jgi:transcriptional antiterminator Rof (Rho-off)
MHHEKLEIELGQNTNNIEGWASDIFTSDKCEYIKIKDSDGCLSNIRLDIIVSYKVIK